MELGECDAAVGWKTFFNMKRTCRFFVRLMTVHIQSYIIQFEWFPQSTEKKSSKLVKTNVSKSCKNGDDEVYLKRFSRQFLFSAFMLMTFKDDLLYFHNLDFHKPLNFSLIRSKNTYIEV